jgi:peroxiredoxin
MALLSSDPVQIGTEAPNFADLPGVDGKDHRLDEYADYDVVVVAFICNHCPYVIAVIDRLVALQAEFEDRSVRLVAISVNDVIHYPQDSLPNMVKFAEEHRLNFPYLYDASQKSAVDYGAVCTPDIFVFDSERKLRYRGRIDDNWKEPAKVTRRELAEALKALVAGRAVSDTQNPTIGCSMKWKR